MKLRTGGAVFATALIALTAAAPAAKAAREPLNAYRVAPTAENKQKLALAGYDMTEADHGSYLEVYGTAKQAAGPDGTGSRATLVGKANQVASQAADVPVGSDATFNVWRRYDRVPNDNKEQYLELYDRLEGMPIVKKVDPRQDPHGPRHRRAQGHPERQVADRQHAPGRALQRDAARTRVAGRRDLQALAELLHDQLRQDHARRRDRDRAGQHARAVVRLRQQPGRLRVHVHARQPAVAQEHGRQQRQRRARRAGRRRRHQPQPRHPLGLRQRGLLRRLHLGDLPRHGPGLRARDQGDQEALGHGRLRRSTRTTTPRPSCCCGPTASSSTRRSPTTSSSRPTRATTTARRSPTATTTPTASGRSPATASTPTSSAELYITNGDLTDDAYANGILAYTPEGSQPNIPNVSGFEFQDVEADIQAEFLRHKEFVLDLARSADDPANPISHLGNTVENFYVETFADSYGDPQTVQVVAKKSLGDVKLRYRINDGAVKTVDTPSSSAASASTRSPASTTTACAARSRAPTRATRSTSGSRAAASPRRTSPTRRAPRPAPRC